MVAWDWQQKRLGFLLALRKTVYTGAKYAFSGDSSKHDFDTHIKILLYQHDLFEWISQGPKGNAIGTDDTSRREGFIEPRALWNKECCQEMVIAYDAPSPLFTEPYTNLYRLHVGGFGRPSRLYSDYSVTLTINLRNSRDNQPQFSQQLFGCL